MAAVGPRPAAAAQSLRRLSGAQPRAELDPKNVEVRNDIANIALAAYVGDPQKPAQLWERLQRLASELEAQPAGRHSAVRIRSYLAVLGNKPEEARRLLEAERRREPLDAEMTGLLVQSYFGGNADAEGEALAAEWIRQHPSQLPMYDLLYAHFGAERESRGGRAAPARKDSTRAETGWPRHSTRCSL